MRLVSVVRRAAVVGSLLSVLACGAATADEILPILAERERRCALDRESQRRRRAKPGEGKMAKTAAKKGDAKSEAALKRTLADACRILAMAGQARQ